MRKGDIRIILAVFLTVILVACGGTPLPENPPLPTAVPQIEATETSSEPARGEGAVDAGSGAGEGEGDVSAPTHGPIVLPTTAVLKATEQPSPPDTPSAEDTRTHRNLASKTLPASLYFLRADTKQVAELGVDGVTTSQITDEPFAISDFDIDENTLAIVSNNELIVIDRNSGSRDVRVVGGIVGEDGEGYWTNTIRSPRIAPDGQSIVYIHNGVMQMSLSGTGPVQTLLAQAPLPDFSDPNLVFPDEPIRLYTGVGWSPQGDALNLSFGYFPEAGGVGIYRFDSGELFDLSMRSEGGVGCCDFSWGSDGSAYIASDLFIYGTPGLARVDTNNGTVRTIITPDDDPDMPQQIFRGAFEASDGALLALGGERYNFGDESVLTLQSISAEGVATTLGSTRFVVPGQTVLWAEDGSGVLVEDRQFGRSADTVGTMRWLTVAGEAIELPVSGTNFVWGNTTEESSASTQPDLDLLIKVATEEFGIGENEALDMVFARPLLTADQTLYVAHTTGLRSFQEDGTDHQLALYAWDGASWSLAASQNLSVSNEEGDAAGGGPDYLAAGAIEQAFIESDNLWLFVDGGVGAHGGVVQLLRFDGTTFHLESESFSASPGAGWLEDLDGDGWQELILDASDPYIVFCYACGVRLVNYAILHWVDDAIEEVTFNRLEDDASAEIQEANDLAIDLASVNLWGEASQIAQTMIQSGNPDAYWNAKQILIVAQGRASAIDSSWPLISTMFYGDYDRASTVFLPYSPEQILDPAGPLIAGTVAEGWLDTTLPLMVEWTTQTISYREEPGAYFLRGWAKYLQNPQDVSAADDIRRAAELNPDNAVYPDVATWLDGQ